MKPPAPDRLLLRVEEAAELLGISRSKLYQELDKSIPTVRVGRTVRVPREWLERWVRERVSAWEQAHGDP